LLQFNVLQLATWYVTTILVESWMKQVRYKKAIQMSIYGPWEGIFWPMGLSQFLCQKKEEKQKINDKPFTGTTSSYKTKKLTTNKDPYSTSFVKEEKTKATFYPLVKS